MGYTDAVTDVAMREKMLKMKIDPLTFIIFEWKIKYNKTSDAYPGVEPTTGLVNEPTGELLCTASQKARRHSRVPSCTAWKTAQSN